MTIDTKRTRPETRRPEEPRRLIPWRQRTTYRVSSNAKQRKRQLRDQSNYLMMTLVVTVVLGGLFIYFNWRGVGSTKTVSCAEFPEFCVPLAGGATGATRVSPATIPPIPARWTPRAKPLPVSCAASAITCRSSATRMPRFIS